MTRTRRLRRRRDPAVKVVGLFGLAIIILVVGIVIGDPAFTGLLVTVLLFLALIMMGNAMRGPSGRGAGRR